jgi:hypothetical protein
MSHDYDLNDRMLMLTHDMTTFLITGEDFTGIRACTLFDMTMFFTTGCDAYAWHGMTMFFQQDDFRV